MKKGIKIFITSLILMMTLSIENIYAAGFSVSRSTSSVSPGGRFTVSVSCQGAGQFSVSASNGSVSSSSLWVDGSGSVTVTAGSSGTVTVSVSAIDVTGYDESSITGSRSVSVSINTPTSSNNSNSSQTNSSSSSSNTTNNNTTTTNETNNQTTQQQEETKKSNNNNLSSLTLSTGTLNPEFNSNQTNYEVNVDAKMTEITIDAKALDSKASITGTGKHSLQVGSNTFEIKCKAENGSVKTYTITINVDETPLVYLKHNKQKLGVVRNVKDLGIPESFEATTIKIDDQDVTAYHNNNMNKTILYLVNEKADFGFYHLTNDAAPGEDVTWFDFAKEILKDTDVLVKPVDSSKFPAKAKRPFNSTMSLEKAKATGFVIPTWQDALASMLEKGDLRENKDGLKGEISKK